MASPNVTGEDIEKETEGVILSGLNQIFSFFRGTRPYGLVHLKADLFAGLTVALILIPQSMAYAQLAGLPSYYGLYASVLPPMIAGLFGSSRQLSTGPVAMVSLMAAVALEPLATAGTQEYVAYAMLLSLLVGGFQFALGALKLGLLVNLISHPVINGFTNAAAVIIATSQVSKLVGVQVDNADWHYETMIRVAQAALHFVHWPTVWIGGFSFVLMMGLKKLNPKIPNVLAAVAVTTLISWGMGFEKHASAPLGMIQDAEAGILIRQFNAASNKALALSDEKTTLSATLASGARSGLQLIELKRDMAVAELELAGTNDKITQLRERLRRFVWIRAAQPDGSWLYLPEDEPLPSKRSESDSWRLRVGRKPLPVTAIPLTGGGEVVGRIPQGLPSLQVPEIDFRVVVRLLPFCLVIGLIGFMEAISIAKAMAAHTGQRIDPNRELMGQGLANSVGALGMSYPCAGSFSRSAVNLQAGAYSGLSSLFSSLIVVAALFLFTPLLYHLPQAVLAAIIMMAVAGLINFRGVVHAWRVQWYDGAISIVTFLCTLGFAPHLERGIAVGVVLSLAVFLYKNMRPKVVDLSLGLDHELHDAVSFGLKECRFVDVVRFDGPLCFANASYLEEQIRHRRLTKKELKHIIIVSNGINDMDASGEEVLSLVVDRVRSAGMDISFSGVNDAVMAVLRRTHLLAKIGEDHIYPSMKTAIRAVHDQTHRGGREESCPLTHVVLSDYIQNKGS